MKRILISAFLLLFTCFSCADEIAITFDDLLIEAKSLKFFDKTRNRSAPVEVYVSGESESKANAGISKLPVVIINHGYGAKIPNIPLLPMLWQHVDTLL